MVPRTIQWSLMFGLIFTISAIHIVEKHDPITIPLNQPTPSVANVSFTGDAHRFREESESNDNKTTTRNGETSDDDTTCTAMMIPLRPTIIGPEKFDSVDDVMLIYEEFKRNDLDCFLDTLMSIVGKRTGDQREEILWALELEHGEAVYNSTISSWKHGKFGIDPLLFLAPATVINSYELEEALNDFSGSRILEILLSLNNSDRAKTLREYKNTYDTEFLNSLNDSDPSTNYMSIVNTLCNNATNESSIVTEGKANETAELLVTLLEGSEKVNLTVLNSILLTVDSDELRSIDRKYFQLTNHTITTALNTSINKSQNSLRIYKTIVKLVMNTPKYFAERLKRIIHKEKPSFNRIHRILIARSEIDLGNIKLYYHYLYERHLSDDLKKITTGKHQQLLLTLLGEFDYDNLIKNNGCNRS